MLKSIRRYFGRRNCAPVVGAVPVWLARNFGAHEVYSQGQVKRAGIELKLDAALIPIALAACCTVDEFHRAFPSSLSADYHALRSQLTDLYELPTEAFTCKHLRRLKDIPRHHGTNSDNGLAGGDGGSGSDGGSGGD